ncbi:MAG TPA: aminopeptidase P family protein [Halobacteriales archaeon]|jgi:Xaa-Pro dipeptidase|nr:aminopeptidase P family protein [Halobacteriales archaeon]
MISSTRIREALLENGLDILVASSPQNVFYLSGLESLTQRLLGQKAFAIWQTDLSNPIIVLPAVDASIIVDANIPYNSIYTYGNFFLYEGTDISPSDRTVQTIKNENNFESPISALLSAINSLPLTSSIIAIETSGFSFTEFDEIRKSIAPKIEAADDLLSDLRQIKNKDEVKRLKQAVEINQNAIENAIKTVELGMAEQDLARSYESELISQGAYPLFTAIGFGSHGAYPHAVPGTRTLQYGDLIRFDVGCTYSNYSSDIARTFSFGEPDPILQRKYEVLNGSMDHGIDLLCDGVSTDIIFNGVIDYVNEHGPDLFPTFDRNHVGHGIGIDVYDHPTISPGMGTLKSGMVLCIEPPYYELGTAGIQVEDEVHITSNGAKRFSHCHPDLLVI